MSRTRPLALVPALSISSIALALALGGCARGEATSSTTLTSATPPAAMRETRLEEASLRLADEVCKRKASCAEDATKDGPGTSWSWSATSECVAREQPRMAIMLGTWDCSPVSSDARLEACLPALKTASCEPLLAEDRRLPLCPTTESCIDPLRR